MLDSFSSRLKVCRAITGISGTYIVGQVNSKGIKFSHRQFSRWEVGDVDTKRILKSDVLESIIDVFNLNGLPELSTEWLLYGKCIPPFWVDMSNALDEEKAFYIARAMGNGYLLTTVASNYAEPFASPGDQIITREMPPEKLENKIAFIKAVDHKLFLGILNNQESHISLSNISKAVDIKKADIKYCGRLVWIS